MEKEPDFLADWYGDTRTPLAKNDTQSTGTTYERLQCILGQEEMELLLKGRNNMEEVQAVLERCTKTYTERRNSSKVKLWLQKLSSKINYYGNIMDVLVQHHPEYVSLAWGTFKFLFVAVQNHEAVVSFLAKALARISDALPRMEFYSILYPTDRMRNLIQDVFSQLLEFFCRAFEWYREGTFKHIIHSITRPVELSYEDIVGRIEELSRSIDQQAVSASQAELRRIHSKIDVLIYKLDTREQLGGQAVLLKKIDAQQEALQNMRQQIVVLQAINSSAAIDTNHRPNDLQFSGIVTSLGASSLCDPWKAYLYQLTLSKRQRRQAVIGSELVVVKGSFSTRIAVRNFCVGMLEQLHEANIPKLMVLKSPQQDEHNHLSSRVSTIDILKNLTLQALRLSQSTATEKTMSMTCSQFQTATTAKEWFDLFELAICRFKTLVYVVVDLEVLDVDLSEQEDCRWISALSQCIVNLSARIPSPAAKIMLVGYGPIVSRQLGQAQVGNPIVNVARASRGSGSPRHSKFRGLRFGQGNTGRPPRAVR
ncbi:hypothetical protein G7054_g6263 [Neopestalotiopsis clavispora]|nr:hypothetical protein G7054_g6263 [Neopestalotiopsis clavispora]